MTLQLKATEALVHVGQNFSNYSQFNAQGHGNVKCEIPVGTGSFQQVVKTTCSQITRPNQNYIKSNTVLLVCFFLPLLFILKINKEIRLFVPLCIYFYYIFLKIQHFHLLFFLFSGGLAAFCIDLVQ